MNRIITILIVVIMYGCGQEQRESLLPPQPQVKYFLNPIYGVKFDLDKIDHCKHKFDDDVSDGIDFLQNKLIDIPRNDESKITKYFESQLNYEAKEGNTILQDIYSKLKKQSHQYNLDDKIYVIDMEIPNACIVINKIFITQGLIDKVDLNTSEGQAQIALVISHEIGHLVNHYQHYFRLANAYYAHEHGQLGLKDELFGFIGSGLERAFQFSNQSNEIEADLTGLYLVSKAGYNLDDALTVFSFLKDRHTYLNDNFFKKIKKDFTRSHPPSNERVDCMQVIIDEARCVVDNKLIEIKKKGNMIEETQLYYMPHQWAEKSIFLFKKQNVFVGWRQNKWVYIKTKSGRTGWVKDEFIKY
jgi:hypothetical protein